MPKPLRFTKTGDFVDTVPTAAGELDDVRTVPGALWAQADGEGGQCGVCVTPEGAGSLTLNSGGQRMTLRVSQGAMAALSAMLAAAASAMAQFGNKRDIA